MGLFIDTFTHFPQSLFGLAVPDLGVDSKFLGSHMPTYTVTDNSYEYDGSAIKYNIIYTKAQSHRFIALIRIGWARWHQILLSGTKRNTTYDVEWDREILGIRQNGNWRDISHKLEWASGMTYCRAGSLDISVLGYVLSRLCLF
jgi:hypothetical protein